MEIQESHHSWHESWSETDINPGSNRVGYSGPLSGTITSNKTGDVTYEAESPDEGAFLVAAREEYKNLNLLDFTSKRKRMSVIVRDEDGQIILFCKGADSIIFDRLSKNGRMYEEVTTRHLNEYGEAGLHTLALAYRKLDESEYTSWNHEFLKATQYQSANIIKCYWRLGGVFGAGVVSLEVGFVGGGEGCIEAAGAGGAVLAAFLLLAVHSCCCIVAWMLLLWCFLGSCVVATVVLLPV
ncbi:hypothetical protein Pint_25511 [Pistacia integerrima]|uniref:Uncharacterized protein n=1 Tax=Pistacia integerrima TaxID=434235 RepID=A0ACC0YEH6_9ROSI|nr:hypothetical protein Pint_25511 [Pistacia integerrima]